MKTTNTKTTRCTKKEIVFLPRQFPVQADDKKLKFLTWPPPVKLCARYRIPRVSYLNIKLFSSQQKTLHRVCDIKSAGLRWEQ